MKSSYTGHIAEFNQGVLKYDWGRPEIAGVQDNLERVNAVATRAARFVWRLGDDAMEAAQLDTNSVLGGNVRPALTQSVRTSLDALYNFVHKTVHGNFMQQRDSWFVKSEGPAHVIWPVAVGHRPTVQETVKRLEMLGVKGPTSLAFEFSWLRQSTLPA
ncbi:MAG: DUF3291 domain-containing protein [Paracoccaceae bacterium]